MPIQVVINWGVSSFYGWGVYGLNLALAWAADPQVEAACAMPILADEFVVDPLRRAALAAFGRRSASLQAQLVARPPGEAKLAAAVLDGLHQSFEPVHTRPDTPLVGQPSLGVTFFQDTQLAPEAVERARRYPAVVAGSTWNARLLQAHGLSNVRTILQGIDPALFHPAPRLGLFPDRFVVFSGGKLERRKGQDIVMAAFARFAQARPDALLAAAWHSPWPAEARTLEQGGVAAALPFDAEGRVDVAAWAAACGVPARQFLDLGAIPNLQLAPVLREMDVAVFPNRGEGGTNLVAMECMACGVPAILSRNTGHLDLIQPDNSYTLDRQASLEGLEGPMGDVEGWGESDVDEVVARLEQAYEDRAEARARGLRGAQTLARLTWAGTAGRMKALIDELR
ncbi:glycosyltransferase family 4 protein [Phenylobacterium sp.]|jgi:glycosyltransferase involved in cell wall biosynthesis|uniref:glycosyltransferase family 4 protein n=1 Tax=Phenylobacterium sp. TaxID=1871053 RepID=UPI002F929E40